MRNVEEDLLGGSLCRGWDGMRTRSHPLIALFLTSSREQPPGPLGNGTEEQIPRGAILHSAPKCSGNQKPT